MEEQNYDKDENKIINNDIDISEKEIIEKIQTLDISMIEKNDSTQNNFISKFNKINIHNVKNFNQPENDLLTMNLMEKDGNKKKEVKKIKMTILICTNKAFCYFNFYK